MRTAGEILHEYGHWGKSELIKAINEARKEAIEECAEIAESIEGWSTGLRKESILSLIKKLI